MKNKIVYVGMCADLLHNGHINIIKQAKKYGSVVVGLLSDYAIEAYKNKPALSYEQRKIIVSNIVGVAQVIEQKTLSYRDNLIELKPNYVVHGDDWKKGIQSKTREEVIELLKLWDGELVEVEYTSGVSSTELKEKLQVFGITPPERLSSLRNKIEKKCKTDIVRILEVHNGISSLIVEKTSTYQNQKRKEFDGMWLSSLTHSACKGKPDIEYIDNTLISNTINEIFDVTTKPMIVDVDSGGLIEHFRFTVRSLERLGVSSVIIEDKIGSKRNSLFEGDNGQKQDSIESFCNKIAEGKKSQKTKDFMIIARIESLIMNKGQEDALKRAFAYVAAGADGIMIHSKKKDPQEIIDFCSQFRKNDTTTPLIVVPSTYDKIYEKQLIEIGVNVVIYANHLLRSAYPAMVATAKSILQNERCHEASKNCMPIKEIINLIPGV